jgi:hypothetical protein
MFKYCFEVLFSYNLLLLVYESKLRGILGPTKKDKD